MKRLRDLDEYERETLFRVILIVGGLAFIVVLIVVASMLQTPTGEPPELPPNHMSPFPYLPLSTEYRLRLFPFVLTLAGVLFPYVLGKRSLTA